MPVTTTAKLWQPSPERIARARLTEFAARLAAAHGAAFPDYAALWRWTVDNKADFWKAVWDYAGIVGEAGTRVLVDADRMPGARFFPDARLNFAENLLAPSAARVAAGLGADALVFRGEDRVAGRTSDADLLAAVSRVQQSLAALGVVAGDRVAAYLPNLPEAVVAMAGAASLGAIWSSCSPDFGVEGVLDRFGQIAPRVLFTVDGYWYNGKPLPIPRQGGGDRRRAAVGRARRRRALPARLGRRGRRPRGGARCADLGGVHRALRAAAARVRRASRSTIRCTSCTPRARPACPSASSTARAARCCST